MGDAIREIVPVKPAPSSPPSAVMMDELPTPICKNDINASFTNGGEDEQLVDPVPDPALDSEAMVMDVEEEKCYTVLESFPSQTSDPDVEQDPLMENGCDSNLKVGLESSEVGGPPAAEETQIPLAPMKHDNVIAAQNGESETLEKQVVAVNVKAEVDSQDAPIDEPKVVPESSEKAVSEQESISAPPPKKRYRIPLRSVKILFDRCVVRLVRCDHLLTKSNSKTKSRARKPGPKSKTRLTSEIESVTAPQKQTRSGRKPGPKSKTRVPPPPPITRSKRPGPKSKTQTPVRLSKSNGRQPPAKKLAPRSKKKVAKKDDDEDFVESLVGNLSQKQKSNSRRRFEKKELKCPKCNVIFTQHLGLRAHMAIHRNGAKPTKWSYKCPTCGKLCGNSQSLIVHQRVHSGERPYKCTWKGCGKAFITSNNLNSHSRIHTGEKPFECETCGKRFAHSSNFKFHMKSNCQRA